jgi:hypothetical protein
MGRRRLLVMTGAAALLGVAAFVLFLWLTTPAPGITWENFRHLQLGMSANAVQGLLGEPAEALDSSRAKIWRGEAVVIYLFFDADQRVKDGIAASQEQDFSTGKAVGLRRYDSFLDRIRRWLPW